MNASVENPNTKPQSSFGKWKLRIIGAIAGAILSILAVWQFTFLGSGESITTVLLMWAYAIAVWPLHSVCGLFGWLCPVDGHLRSWKTLCAMAILNAILTALVITILQKGVRKCREIFFKT